MRDMAFAEPREFAKWAVQHSGSSLNKPEFAEFRDDKEIALLAVQTFGPALQYCSSRLKDDKEIVTTSLNSCLQVEQGFWISDISPRLLADKDIARFVLYNAAPHQDYLGHFSEEIRADKNLIVASRSSIRHASDEIKADWEIVRDAVKYRPHDFAYASDSFKGDRTIALDAVRGNGAMLKHATPNLQDDTELAMIAVKSNPYALQYVSPRLRNNLEIVLEAVKQDEEAGHFASKDIKKLIGDGDPVEVLTKAVQSEKLAAKLSAQLKPKSVQQERILKI